ncbi:hypothetical protein MSG28_012067 [Choristoneura fumiferana]|uniref:Uncharacterized protein n=1 Tax=Choristoneura fumiferana TaxID=7141 RepID=A0ACC0KMZ8_CHOFU|nr:hypothetical protein MSG28_012067 [Choristoneura fumiferana]
MYFCCHFRNMYSIFVLICGLSSSSRGVKLNVHGEMSIGSNAAGLLGKMLQVYDGDNHQNQQSKDGIRNNPSEMAEDKSKEGEKGKRSHRYPWYTWYQWYDEYKKHKHGSGHKHHKKHHHHHYDLDYYYSSYEDDYKKHIIIPSDNGYKKHIVIPKDRDEGKKKHIVIPKNGDDSNEEHGIFSGLGSMIWGKQNKRIQKPYGSQEDEQHNGSRDGKRWKPPQYGSGENTKGYDQGYGGMEDTPSAHGFLRQLWNMYKTFREKESNLFI